MQECLTVHSAQEARPPSNLLEGLSLTTVRPPRVEDCCIFYNLSLLK